MCPTLKKRAASELLTRTLEKQGSSVPILRNLSTSRSRAFLLPLGLLMLSFAVFGWGLQYKLSLYQSKDSISHQAPEAKLLSQKERPAAVQPVSARPTEIPAWLPFAGLLMLAAGLRRAAARYARPAIREKSRACPPLCLQVVFLRPPPALI